MVDGLRHDYGSPISADEIYVSYMPRDNLRPLVRGSRLRPPPSLARRSRLPIGAPMLYGPPSKASSPFTFRHPCPPSMPYTLPPPLSKHGLIGPLPVTTSRRRMDSSLLLVTLPWPLACRCDPLFVPAQLWRPRGPSSRPLTCPGGSHGRPASNPGRHPCSSAHSH
jgi:hypothetical protein